MLDKLLEIQRELKVPKNQYNSFGKYKYRSCEDILNAVKPLCHSRGLTVTLSDEMVCVGDRNYIKSTARLENTVKTNKDADDFVETHGWAREEEVKKGMDGAQITGACSSYARKYALNGLFAIDDTKDSDATNKHGKDNKIEYPEPPTDDTEYVSLV